MKKSVPSILASICLILLISVPSFGGNIGPNNNIKGCFVELNDGKIVEYKSLELVTGFLVTPHLLADETIEISAKDVQSYRDSKGRFAVAQKLADDKKESKVATDVLPGFALCVSSGKINLYQVKRYNGHITVSKFYLQVNDGQLVAYTPETLASLIKDDIKATEICKSGRKTDPKCLIAAVELYNRNAESFTSN